MPKIEDNPVYQDFQVTEILLRALHQYRSPPGLLITGPAGLGKTRLVRKTHLEYQSQDVVGFRGSPRGLLQYLYENRDGFMLFDDFDAAFFNPGLTEVLKIVLDSNEPRILVHHVMGQTALPPFTVTAGVIFCSNLDFDDPSNWTRRYWETYIKPLKSRLSMSIIKISFEPTAIYEYSLWMAPEILNTVERYDNTHSAMRRLTSAQQQEIIAHFRDNTANYPEHTPRILRNLGLRRLGIPNDKNWHLVRRRMLHDLMKEKEAAAKEAEARRQEAEKSAAGMEQPRTADPKSPLPPRSRYPHTYNRRRIKA